MNRLTRNSLITDLPMPVKLQESCGEDACKEACEQYVDYNCNGCPVQECMTKLAAYEDTGLESEDILSNIKTLSSELNNAFEELKEYRRLEEQGLLIKLPCKVESTVYRILYDRNIENSKVESFEFSEEGIFVRVSYESPIAYITSSYPIEDLFLTREEAEKALEVENE